MKVYLILVCIMLVLAVAVFFFAKLYIAERKKLKRADEEKKQLQKNISYLVHHAEELASIRLEKEKTDKKIEEAKTDEEVADIVNSIINGNNDRVRKQ